MKYKGGNNLIINKDIYECPKCKEWYFYDTSKPFDTKCPKCNIEMNFIDNADCDTERAREVSSKPLYDVTKDPKSPFYKPQIICPYCHSSNVTKISNFDRVVSTGLFGLASKKVGKQWHCNNCKSDF